jgi:hypothetical protein
VKPQGGLRGHDLESDRAGRYFDCGLGLVSDEFPDAMGPLRRSRKISSNSMT